MSVANQFIVVGVIVTIACAFVMRSTWRTWFHWKQAGSGCGSGCGKCSAAPTEPQREGRYPLPLG